MDPVTRKFEGITSAQFDGLAERVQEKTGVKISSHSGTASDAKGKYIISWTFLESTGELVITCTKAPLPDRLFPSKIGDAIAQMVNAALLSA
jgi:hypothetical protein